MSRPTVITLSTIPSRFHLLGPTFDSLLSQSLPARCVRLYIPASYRRFPEWNGSMPDVPHGVTICRCATDLGPATKILPAVREYADQNVDLLFCDDDKIYDPSWHARFKRTAAAHPGCCIVEAGENLPDIADSARPEDRLPRARRWSRKPLSYRIRRVLSGFRIKSPMYANSGYVDLLSGHGGVLMRPNWLDDDAWDIPDIIWTVDDPWLSGQLERKGVPIWLNAEVPRMEGSDAGDVSALHDLVEQQHNRVRADIAAIEYMRSRYGIWPPKGPVTAPARHMTETIREIARRGRSGN